MDYSFYPTQAAPAQPHYFNNFPPTPTHNYEAQDGPTTDQADFFSSSNAYQNFDPSFQFDPSFIAQEQSQQPPQQQHSPPISNHGPSLVALDQSQQNGSINGSANGSISGQVKQDYDTQDQMQKDGSSGDEGRENMTPAQQRRKVQNRAAQRAFRERKERHVKDLESKLNDLSAHSSSLLTDNERLKRELQRLSTQNEILRATAHSGPAPRSPSPVHGPQTYSPTDFATAAGLDLQRHPLSYEDFGGEQGHRLLAAGATWDLIQNHDLYRRGMVDVADVCERLKGRAACDGRGPAFRESEVIKAIQESVLSGSDELI